MVAILIIVGAILINVGAILQRGDLTWIRHAHGHGSFRLAVDLATYIFLQLTLLNVTLCWFFLQLLSGLY